MCIYSYPQLRILFEHSLVLNRLMYRTQVYVAMHELAEFCNEVDKLNYIANDVVQYLQCT